MTKDTSYNRKMDEWQRRPLAFQSEHKYENGYSLISLGVEQADCVRWSDTRKKKKKKSYLLCQIRKATFWPF